MFHGNPQSTGQSAASGAIPQLFWSTKIQNGNTPPVVGADGTLYIGVVGGKFCALEPTMGNVKWSYTAPGDSVFFSAAVIGANGTVYSATIDQGDVGHGANDKLYAFDGLTGNVLWTFDPGDGVICEPAMGADGTIYVATWGDITMHASLFAIDGNTGNAKWGWVNPVLGSFFAGGISIGAD